MSPRKQTGHEKALQAFVILFALLPVSAAMVQDTPDAHLTIFEDLGQMVPDSAFIHVLVPVDLRNFSSLFDAAPKLLKEHLRTFRASTTYQYALDYVPHYDRMSYLTMHPEMRATQTNAAGISIAHQMYRIQATFNNITTMLPQKSDNEPTDIRSRQKRIIPYLIGLAAAAIAGAIIGTLLGPYNQAQFNALPLLSDMDMLLHVDDEHHQMLDNLNERIEHAFAWLNETDTTYRNPDNHNTIWAAVVSHLQSKLDLFIDFVTQLQHRRLSLTWFSTKQLQKIHDSVVRQAQKNNLLPLTSHLTDYFQLDVSYVRSDHFLTAIIHVPTSSSNNFFRVYRYVPFPIPLSDHTVMHIHAREDIIAVGHNNQHKVLTQTQLDNCQRHYQLFICESPLTTNTNFSSTCIGSLMDHNALGIQTHCSISTKPSQESVFQVTNNQFAIYSPETFTGRGHCNNGSHLSALISTISQVTVPPGCTFKLRQHILTVPINAITAAEPWVQETKWDTLQVPRQLLLNDLRRREALHELLARDNVTQQSVHDHLRTSARLLNITHATIDQQTKEVHETVNRHKYYLVGLAAAAILIATVLLCCMCQRYRNAATMFQPVIANYHQALPGPAPAEAKF